MEGQSLVIALQNLPKPAKRRPLVRALDQARLIASAYTIAGHAGGLGCTNPSVTRLITKALAHWLGGERYGLRDVLSQKQRIRSVSNLMSM